MFATTVNVFKSPNIARENITRCIRCLSESSQSRSKLTTAEVRKKRNAVFEREQARQMAFVKRIEKIKVTYNGLPEPCTLIMNKDISTPYNCAMHMQEYLTRRTVLALVNGAPWDMHRPLTADCNLQFLHMMDEHPNILNINKIFWRTCSFLLGHIMETAFKDEHYVQLCSFPICDVTTGSFVYDMDLDMVDWKPSTMELNCLSTIGGKTCHKNLPFQRLDIDASVALEMFEDNRFKSAQIPDIAASARDKTGTVTVYRMGDHIDISRGPMLASTGQIGRFRLSSIHSIESNRFGALHRVQGLATPTDQYIHWFSFDYLVKRSEQLNMSGLDHMTETRYHGMNEPIREKPKSVFGQQSV